MEKLTHLIFTLLIFDPLKNVVDDATSGGVVEESVFVVDNEAVSKKTEVKQNKVSSCRDGQKIPMCQIIVFLLTDVSSIG